MTADGAEHEGQSRAERVRIAVLTADPAELSRALRRMPKHLSEAIAKQVGVPAPVLRRDPSPARFLRRTAAPPVFSTVADVLTADCLDATIEQLGSAADDPTLNQLRAAVDAVAEEHPHATIALTLAATAASGAPAALACEQILADDERFAIPTELPDDGAPGTSGTSAAPTSSGASSGPTPEELAAREERKARKAERKAKSRERQHKAREAAERQRRERRQKGGDRDGGAAPTEEGPTGDELAAATSPTGGAVRRAATLSPAEAAEFDAEDPLVGSVVIARVDFDGDDLDHPELTAKQRPAVVVGVAADELLVRPGYSEGGVKARTWQSVEVQDRHEAGLHGRTWIERDTRRIARLDASAPVGRLSTTDWNALW